MHLLAYMCLLALLVAVLSESYVGFFETELANNNYVAKKNNTWDMLSALIQYKNSAVKKSIIQMMHNMLNWNTSKT